MPDAHRPSTTSTITITTTIATTGNGDRRRFWNNEPSAGGFTRGSVVAFPQR